jgi:hypothetical protein
MVERSQIRRRDALTGASVALLLVVAYVVSPDPILQYGVWLAIFTIWMAWFVAVGVDWLSREPTDGAGDDPRRDRRT